jgi:hypothetical protein
MQSADRLLTVRKALHGILAIGLVGTGAELLLLGHYDDVWRLVPVVLIPVALVALAVRVASDGVAARRVFLGAMALCLLSGLLGTFLHYKGNAEFEREMTPDIAGWKLFSESMTGATPALAPGAMILFALIGFAAERTAGPFRPNTHAEG